MEAERKAKADAESEATRANAPMGVRTRSDTTLCRFGANVGNEVVAGGPGRSVELDRVTGELSSTQLYGDTTTFFSGVCHPAQKLF